MGRSFKSKSGNAEIDRLRVENHKLKKQISKLRKQMSRIDIDRYSSLKEMIESEEDEIDNRLNKENKLQELKTTWACNACKNDYLRVIMIPRTDGLFYIRKCGSCSHKTRMKKYTESVDGVGTNGDIISAKTV